MSVQLEQRLISKHSLANQPASAAGKKEHVAKIVAALRRERDEKTED